MKTRNCKYSTHDKIESKKKLLCVKKSLIPIFEEMGVSRSKISSLKFKIGTKKDFEDISGNAYLKNDKEIVIKKGTRADSAISSISHEVGHAVTRTGTIGGSTHKRSLSPKKIVSEATAYGFEKRAIKKFNKKTGSKIKHKLNVSRIKSEPEHAIGYLLSGIPFSRVIKKR